MSKIFKLNVVGPAMLGIVMVFTSVLVIVWPIMNNQFSLALIPVSLAFFVFGLYCFYWTYKFLKLNKDANLRLIPSEKKQVEKQRKYEKKINSDSLIVIVWSILAFLFGSVFLLSGLEAGEINYILIGSGIILVGLFVGIFLKDK